MPNYLEFATDAEVEDAEEWLGRQYAKSLGKPYPIVPAETSPGRLPDDLTELYTYFYVRAELKDPGVGGVITIDDWMATLPAAEETLTDGTVYSLDIEAKKKAQLLLSAAGRRAINRNASMDGSDPAVRQAVVTRERRRQRRARRKAAQGG